MWMPAQGLLQLMMKQFFTEMVKIVRIIVHYEYKTNWLLTSGIKPLLI